MSVPWKSGSTNNEFHYYGDGSNYSTAEYGGILTDEPVDYYRSGLQHGINVGADTVGWPGSSGLVNSHYNPYVSAMDYTDPLTGRGSINTPSLQSTYSSRQSSNGSLYPRSSAASSWTFDENSQAQTTPSFAQSQFSLPHVPWELDDNLVFTSNHFIGAGPGCWSAQQDDGIGSPLDHAGGTQQLVKPNEPLRTSYRDATGKIMWMVKCTTCCNREFTGKKHTDANSNYCRHLREGICYCDRCGDCFTRSDNRNTHQRKCYPCKLCSKRFTTADALNIHMNIKHPG